MSARAEQGDTVTQKPSQRKQVNLNNARSAKLMKKFPNTWVSISKAKNKNAAQSYVWQLKHDSSKTLPASEFSFQIHEVNNEWWVQAIYIGEDD